MGTMKTTAIATALTGIGLVAAKELSQLLPDKIIIDLSRTKIQIANIETFNQLSLSELSSGVKLSTEYKNEEKKKLVCSFVRAALPEVASTSKEMINVTPKRKN